jgi:TPR repeat protein
LLAALSRAYGYCHKEKDQDVIGVLISEKLEVLIKTDDPRVKHLQATLPNLGSQESYVNAEAFDLAYDKLMKEAADGGVAEAQYQYACRLYEQGNLSEAVGLYREAADKGYPPAQYCYGLDRYNGVGTDKNIVEGLKYIKLAAGRLDEYALAFLVELYSKDSSEEGTGNHQLYLKMLSWVE